MEKDNAAIYVRFANKSYGSKQILDNFSMTVPKGSIYGLLGASGCGKTTLLSCAVGRKRFDSGEVWVLGGKPGHHESGVPGPKVGYMPQDVALVAEFTIRDAFFYFGRIFKMPDEAIKNRLQDLTELLDLPPDNRYVGNCSGGQQRRVSFAVALLHDPELLILDEPTVGLDPVLRDKIWNHLVELAENKGTSIIITTHYIEETKQAHKIGLMRQGKLLAEESPSTLLQIFRTETLEEVFLLLSQQQSDGKLPEIRCAQNPDNRNLNNISLSQESSVDSVGVGSTDFLTPKRRIRKPIVSSLFSGYRLKALFRKNWKQLYRNLSGLSFMCVFPVLQMCAFLTAIGGDLQNINIAVINEESNLTSCSDYLINETAIYDSDLDLCSYRQLGCRFLDAINTSLLNQIHYDDLDTAVQDVKRGIVTGVLHIHKNFSRSIQEKVHDYRDLSNETLENSLVAAYMDMSDRQIGTTIKYDLINKTIDLQREVLKECGYREKLAEIPVKFEEFLYGEKDESYVIFIIPGALITMIFFLGTTNTSTIIISDRLEGVWDRSIVAGVTSAEILLAHFVTQLLIICFQSAVIIVITFVIFNFDWAGSMYCIVLIIVLQGLCGISYGFLISIVCSDHNTANIMSTGVFYPMILTCGLVWPIESMPSVLRWISQCLPFTIPISSLRNIVKKGWNLTNMSVLDGVGIEVLWLLFLGAISSYELKKRR